MYNICILYICSVIAIYLFPPTSFGCVSSLWPLNTTTTWWRVCARSIGIKKKFYYNLMTKYLWGQPNLKGIILTTVSNQVFPEKLTRKASKSYANNWQTRIQQSENKSISEWKSTNFCFTTKREKIGTDSLIPLVTWTS